MLGAFLTPVFFALSGVLAARSVQRAGITFANLGRLLCALVILGAYAHTAGSGMSGAGRDLFLLSGVVGMGLGDLALFAALPRLGSRLGVLMTQCLAVPVAIVAEWIWLGTRLAPVECWWSTIILSGVMVALMPSRSNPPRAPIRAAGFIFGALSAIGQGLGAVISRQAYAVTTAAGESVDGISAAYQRIAGGLVVSACFFLALHLLHRRLRPSEPAAAVLPRSRGAYGLVLANAVAGPVIGVSCYQWALSSTPSGIVLPIVATTPLVIIPLSAWLEGDRPTARSILGGVIAVLGVVALTWVH